VCDRPEGLDGLTGSYPEGHDMARRFEEPHIERALEAVEEAIWSLMDALQYPRGT
jgi:hypothetical protein